VLPLSQDTADAVVFESGLAEVRSEVAGVSSKALPQRIHPRGGRIIPRSLPSSLKSKGLHTSASAPSFFAIVRKLGFSDPATGHRDDLYRRVLAAHRRDGADTVSLKHDDIGQDLRV
jgi:hypothetical protein